MWTCFINTFIGIRLKFISPLKDQTVKEGQTARFELELSHDNIPVTWYKNDVKIHPSRAVLIHVDGKKHVLEIKDVTLDDICQIKAEAKGIPSMANLTVIGNPRTITCPLLSSLSFFSTVLCSECPCLSVWVHKGLCLSVWYFLICPHCVVPYICPTCVLESHLHCPPFRGRSLFHSQAAGLYCSGERQRAFRLRAQQRRGRHVVPQRGRNQGL